jgi:hypothetical protein
MLRRSGTLEDTAPVAIPGLQRITIAREDARKRAYGAAPRPGNVPRHYSASADSVLQAAILPCLKPAMNQRLRCSDVPWVKASGTT